MIYLNTQPLIGHSLRLMNDTFYIDGDKLGVHINHGDHDGIGYSEIIANPQYQQQLERDNPKHPRSGGVLIHDAVCEHVYNNHVAINLIDAKGVTIATLKASITSSDVYATITLEGLYGGIVFLNKKHLLNTHHEGENQ